MKHSNAFRRILTTPRRYQHGIVAIVVTVGMIALLAVTGLALDTGHMLLNKTRVQNATDAAALAAARTLQTSSGDMTAARTVAEATFSNNLSQELSSIDPAIEVTVTYSENLNPGSFANSVTDPQFVKVTSDVIPLQSYLVQVVGIQDKRVNAISVAGFASGVDVCNLIPVMVCSQPNPVNPDNTPVPGYFHGYKLYTPPNPDGSSNFSTDDITTLKVGSGDGPDTDVGTGSFHLLDLPGLQGANDIRYAFAGNPACSGIGDNTPVDLSPGNKVGPTVQGINTRFGIYTGPLNGDQLLYPPDQANDTNAASYCGDGSSTACPYPDDYYNFYNDPTASIDPFGNQFQRRVVHVPIADCSTPATGNNTPDSMVVDGIGCFLLTEPATQTGGSSDDSSGSFRGTFIEDCTPPSSGITQSSGVQVIVLYKNPDGGDS